MALNKTDIVRGVREKVHLKKQKIFEIIKNTLEKGENVRIPGFGSFQVKFKWARKGRNPQTGEKMILNSRRIITFRYSPKLKDKINQGK
jgi:integration host factor subunit alpha